MKHQSIKSKKAEIEFRKKLVRQQVERRYYFDDEFDTKDIEKLLRNRMKNTFELMTYLKESGISLSPYLEIGAERCQRSLVMENELDATGVAIDISYDMLKSCDYYKNVFNKSKVPIRICCDANSLPFMSGSIPFVFCYETLHHFPEPTPITKEIHRVLSPGGHFFFDEEPYKKIIHVKLYKGRKTWSKESLNASKIRQIIDRFFTELNCNEIEFGIVENDEIPINDWRKALIFFGDVDVKLKSIKSIQSELFNPKNFIKFFFAYLFGGGISGICCKSGVSTEREISLHDVLVCPSCIENGRESKLSQKNFSFFCNLCSNEFPIIEDVVFLFSYKKFEEFYPEIFRKITKGLK